MKLLTKEHADLTTKSTAVFSEDMAYRFLLRRVWGPDDTNVLCGLFMNPSTADELKDDMTLKGWRRRAHKLGYDGFSIVNAFGFRSPNPKDLLSSADPVGRVWNDDFIRAEIAKNRTTVVGWGCPPKKVQWRCVEMVRLLRVINRPVYVLGLNNDGSPKHPLYLKDTLELIHWTPGFKVA
jgi:hypothetical protein